MVSDFIVRIRDVPEISEVRSRVEHGIAYVTILFDSRPWDDEPRYRVYRAEGEIVGKYQTAAIDFRLINLSEYPEESRPFLIPNADIIYARNT